MSTLSDHTVLPPPDTADNSELDLLTSALAGEGEISLVTREGEAFRLTPELRNVLVYAAKALGEGRAVSLEPRHSILSTQEAADLLGISRPTLVKLLEANEIPFSKPGRHRRVNLQDLLAYQQRQRDHRRDELDAMSAEGAEIDAYRAANGFEETR
jgi:excisionase family DNA binding protein